MKLKSIQNHITNKICFIKYSEFKKINKIKINKFQKAEIYSAMCRVNTLSMVKVAGSGHLGTSFSAMDLIVWIKYFFSKNKNKERSKNRNIFFSSKGHDAPALYAVLYSLGYMKLKKILNLRRLNGLDGHADVSIPGVEANTGSLGMGISKAKGILWSKKFMKLKGDVIVMTGDGELQEGQIFEALQTSSHQNLNDLIVIVDHNKVQSSQYVSDVINLRNLENKFKSFGWYVKSCDGHSFKDIEKNLKILKKNKLKPKILIANTIKGKGVDFMEHTNVMKKNKLYNWHAGAPDDNSFFNAQEKLLDKLNRLDKKKIIKLSYFNLKQKEFISKDIH